MYILIIIFILLNAVDTIITLYSIREGMHEKNPLLAFVIYHAGLIGFLLAKSLLIVFMIYFAAEFTMDSLVILNVIYTLIVLNNTLKLYIWRSNNDT